ncbi:MAG: EAL domain-containing protein [Rhodocyclales bacterium]|nr:EAL domain-containing protein [Rhodocyclales bacterium]
MSNMRDAVHLAHPGYRPLPLPAMTHGAPDDGRILRVLMDNLDGMVFRCQGDDEARFLFVSGGCEALTGYAAAELTLAQSVTLAQMIHAEEREVVRDTVQAALLSRRPYRVEYRIRCRDGCEKWVLERGNVVFDAGGQPLREGFLEDVSDQVRSQHRLAEAELRYRSIFENSVVGMFRTSADGQYLEANGTLAAMYGYDSPEELIYGMRDIAGRLYVDPGRRAEFARQIRERGRVIDFESEVYRADGRRIWIAENAYGVHRTGGELLYYEGTVEDISERRQYQARLEYQATHDPLTGLANRLVLDPRLARALARAEAKGEKLAVAFVDLDNFKFVNDSLGHAAGDLLLVEVALRLRACLGGDDLVVRYGGDEFVLVLPRADGEAIAATLERVMAEICYPMLIGGREVVAMCTVGVGVYPEDGRDGHSLLKNADLAMHHGKSRGKSLCQFYTAELNAAANERFSLESALRRALEHRELHVVYQPKVDARGLPTGFEALLRWHSPEFGTVSPIRFIPLAEETGLILPITEFVLRTACREAVSWERLGLDAGGKVAVNLSARLFAEPDLVERVAAALGETGLAPERLQLEITESLLIGDVEATVATLESLKMLGVQIAIDDFGTGYSSLAYLKRFPIDILKIDRAFVGECDWGGVHMAIPRAIVSLGHSLGMRIVAEGIERESQLDVLAAQGCEEFQGFLIARPLAPEAAVAFLQGAYQIAAEEASA